MPYAKGFKSVQYRRSRRRKTAQTSKLHLTYSYTVRKRRRKSNLRVYRQVHAIQVSKRLVVRGKPTPWISTYGSIHSQSAKKNRFAPKLILVGKHSSRAMMSSLLINFDIRKIEGLSTNLLFAEGNGERLGITKNCALLARRVCKWADSIKMFGKQENFQKLHSYLDPSRAALWKQNMASKFPAQLEQTCRFIGATMMPVILDSLDINSCRPRINRRPNRFIHGLAEWHPFLARLYQFAERSASKTMVMNKQSDSESGQTETDI